MKRPSLFERLRYAFDNILARGSIALIGLLAVASVGLIMLIALIVRITRLAPDIGFAQLVWMGLMRTLDAGTMGGDSGSWPYLFAMLAVTIGGIFVISTLIGILTTGLESRLEELRKGRSRVLETGHTVILGWSDQIFSILEELVIANANQRRSCIVVLGDKDKVEMEDAIHERIGSAGRTRIVCRSGNPMELNDLAIASLQTAKAIIVLAADATDPDAQVIKTLLAIVNAPDRRSQPYHIVAEVRDPKNMDVARMVGKDEVELVLVGDLIARITAQTCRQSGLSTVYTELLDFSRNEFYFHNEPSLVGRTFGDALFAFDASAVVGICPRGGAPKLNPPMSTLLQEGDRLIVIAEDDDVTRPSGLSDLKIAEAAIQPQRSPVAAAERTLILGWNWRAPAILRELDSYVPTGSTVTVVTPFPEVEAQMAERCPDLRNQACEHRQGDTTERRLLDSLHVAAYDHVIVLAYSDTLDPQQADARTLITLLHLRDIAERQGHPFSITSEMLDIRNRNLAEVTHADDFIVSDKLVSLMLAQVAENRQLNSVFADLFDPEGAEIYLKPAADYVALGEPVNFYTVIESARRRGESAFGYRLAALADDKEHGYGVIVNPIKSQPIAFAPQDRIIMMADA